MFFWGGIEAGLLEEKKRTFVLNLVQEEPVVEGEDTMRNLRTTFAGIFGEIK